MTTWSVTQRRAAWTRQDRVTGVSWWKPPPPPVAGQPGRGMEVSLPNKCFPATARTGLASDWPPPRGQCPGFLVWLTLFPLRSMGKGSALCHAGVSVTLKGRWTPGKVWPPPAPVPVLRAPAATPAPARHTGHSASSLPLALAGWGGPRWGSKSVWCTWGKDWV